MDLQLRVQSVDPDGDLVSLAGWLRDERELTAPVRLCASPIGDGRLGGAFELISIAVGSGGLCTVLASSLSTWLQHRPRTIVKIGRGDLSIEVDSGHVKDLSELIGKLAEIVDEPQQ
ncbi:hypothetical protein ACFYO1_27340 [Nocardia sp. NPDC006044]|uniref:effector-associated constant component EACC1 n=1 Tax=Nocardia sp. NPDC006044 TaxID=3364306 RepID=UPI003694D8F4